MIKLPVHFFKQTEKEEIKAVSPDNKISIQTAVPSEGGKIFSAADLWHIQQKGKTMFTRRWIY